MPIKGRSEIVRIPRVGKIHLGIKKTNGEGKEYPSPTDYFVVRPDDHTTNEAVKAFQSVYGDKPNEIKVAFPSDDPEDFFPQYLTAYKSGGGKNYTLFCRGDGERATRRAEDGSFSEIECRFENCPIYQKKQCKALGRLQFFLPEVPGIGVWQIDSTSYHTTVNLNSSIAMIMALTGGRIKMIPLTLRLVPKVVSPEGFSKTVYVLDLRVEDVKLLDFIQQVPLISAALTPAVEPIRADEIAEDLFIDTDVVDGASGRLPETSTNPIHDESANQTTMGEIGTYVDFEQKPAKNGQPVGKVIIVTENGETIEALTVNPGVLSMLPLPGDMKKIRYQIEPSKKFKDRLELLFIDPVIPA